MKASGKMNGSIYRRDDMIRIHIDFDLKRLYFASCDSFILNRRNHDLTQEHRIMNRERNRIPQPLLKQTLLLIFLVCLILSTQVRAGHGLAPALSLTHIKSTDADRYALLSPGLNYTADFRIKKLHFVLSATTVLPLWATQNGKRYTNSDFYNFYMGTDLFLGIARDYDVQGRFRLSPAVGWHQNGILMRGKPRYLDFYSLTSGIGVHVLATDRRDSRLLNYLFFSLGLDFLDFLYEENRLRTGLSLCLGAGHRF